MVDLLFFLAVGAHGVGACRSPPTARGALNGWPLGERADRSAGLHDLAIGLASVCASGSLRHRPAGRMHGGFVILMFGLALAVFWSGFLRVGAQSALLLAPLSAVALLIAWSAGPLGL